MPELPEVETVCRVLRRALQGKKISRVEVVPDEIVWGGTPPEAAEKALTGATVRAVGRKGKYFWLELDRKPWLFGHLGMSGWIRELGQPTVRLKEHGNAPLDDEAGRPKFLKLLIEAEDGCRIAFTDGRRLGRAWLSDEHDRRVAELGPDSLEDMPTAKRLYEILSKRKAPIKALLLDQALFAGVGNWVADEALYHAKIDPRRLGNSLSEQEVGALRKAILMVLKTAVDAGADEEKYPDSWMFKHRWGGNRGKPEIDGKPIVRETVGGRTTAWVPKVQK